MLIANIPARFGIPWGNSAGGAYIRPIPQASQIGITNGAASLTDGFPPLNFTQIGAGGVPPFGQDFNGILKQITQWNQWQAAGAPSFYDATFSASIGGYPQGAILANASTYGLYWRSQIDNNTSDPDTGGANWDTIAFVRSGVLPNVGTFTRAKITTTAFGFITAAASGAQPTYQKFTSGTGIYMPSAGTVRARVRMAGGGGGSAGVGGASSLGGWGANGGGQSGTPTGGAGGTGGSNGTGVLIDRAAGSPGIGGAQYVATALSGSIAVTQVSPGGMNRMGGGPNSGKGANVSSSTGAISNSSVNLTGGGGAGEYVEFDIINPGALAYSVGGAGAGGTDAQAGVIIVEEFYD